MVILPPQFVSTKYTGYFWNLETQRLYSLKISGVLRPLRLYTPNRFSDFYGYRICVEGKKRCYHMADLKDLNRAHDSMVPME